MKAKRQVQRQLKQDYRRYKRRIAGILGDYSGTVDVPNRVGYVFVRLRNQEVKEAFNKRVPSLVDLPVWVGYSDDPGEPQILQVLDTRTGVERQKGEEPIGLYLPPHHETHEWFNPLGGQDVVFSDKRQFMPFRPTPIGGMLLHVYRNVGWLNGEYTYFSGSSIDLSPYVPATGAYFVLVYEDTNATLAVSSGTGDFLKNAFTLTLADIPNPTPGTYPIAAVRMWGGMTGIVEASDRTDLIDLRFPFTQNFLLLSDVPWSYTGSASQLVAVKSDETGLEFISSAGITGSSPSTFLGLTDTPSSYSGQADKLAVVNAAENALEFRDNTGTSGGGGYDTIQDEGSGLTQQSTFNFVGGGVAAVNDPANNRTTVRIPGTVTVFDDGIFIVSGTALDFMDNLDVAVTGTHVFITGQTGGGGATGTFIGLTDTPENYIGASGSLVTVKGDETGLEFTDGVDIASDNANVAGVNFLEQSSDLPIPGTNHRVLYAKSGGFYKRDDVGNVARIMEEGDAAGGDLTGTYPNPTVKAIQGKTVQSGTPGGNQILIWNASNNRWEFGDQSGGGGGGSGDLLIYDNSIFKVTGTAISFDDNLDVSVTGSIAFVSVSPNAAGGSKTLQTYTVLHSETLGANGRFDVSSISQDYDHLIIRAQLRSTVAAGADIVYMFLNNDTTVANYHRQALFGRDGSSSAGESDTPVVSQIPAASSTADDFALVTIQIFNYTGAKRKEMLCLQGARESAGISTIGSLAVNWENTAAINQVTIQPDGYATDSFAAGSFLEIIGVREEAVGGAAYSIANVSNPPTDAEIDSAFGTPESVGSGFLGLINDAGAGTTLWQVASDGSNWWYEEMTKAT